jgi:hypothetical protein
MENLVNGSTEIYQMLIIIDIFNKKDASENIEQEIDDQKQQEKNGQKIRRTKNQKFQDFEKITCQRIKKRKSVSY